MRTFLALGVLGACCWPRRAARRSADDTGADGDGAVAPASTRSSTSPSRSPATRRHRRGAHRARHGAARPRADDPRDGRDRRAPTSSSTSRASSPPSTTGVAQNAAGVVLDAAAVVGLRRTQDRRRHRPPLLAGPAADGRPGRRRGRRARGDRPGPRRRLRRARHGAARRPRGPRRGVRGGLADCDREAVVVSHDAFGYLEKYGLRIEGVAGLSPDAEPAPADLAALQELAATEGLTTVFSERLASPRLTDTLASDLGHADRGARPGRGAHRRDGRRGLPFADGAEPRRCCERPTHAGEPRRADRRRRRHRRSPGAAQRRPAGRRGRVRRADGGQRLGQVHAGPCADRAAAAEPRLAAACSACRSTTSATGSGSASCRSARAPPPACRPRCGRWSPPAG